MAYILTTPNMGENSLPIIKDQFGIPFYTNDQPRPNDPLVIRWGCRSAVNTDNTINKAKAIKKAYDKGHMRKTLCDNGLAMETYTDFLEWLRKGSTGPFLVRPIHHSRSVDMHVAEAPRDVLKAIDKIKEDGEDYYISKVIDKKAEYRVFVANNRIAWVIKKHPGDPNSISWGCVIQGTFEYIPWPEWPLNVCTVALKSMKHTGLDFGAWDIIVGKDDSIFALEVNTAPHLGPYYAKTVGKALKWMIDQKNNGADIDLPDIFPLSLENEKNWKRFMHPALGT